MADGFIALPGGTGTLEEISEIMSQVSLGLIDAPCVIFNYNKYYDNLKKQLETMVKYGLSTNERQVGIHFAESIEEIIDIINKR